MIYLDNAATTYPKPESVYTVMDNVNRKLAFNAGRGSYKVAKEATKLIDDTKKKLIELVRALPGANVAFTPSITIALNEIIQGAELHRGDNVYITPYEHNAVARVCELIRANKGVNIIQLPVKEDTLEIDIEKTKYLFTQQHPAMVCSIHVSNVTGYILPVKEIFDVAKMYDAITVLDTAQSLGLVDISVADLKVDYIAFAGHKTLYGPLGVGGIISTSGKTKLSVVFAGGTGSNSLNLQMPESSPERYEYASSNIVAIAGLNAAIDDCNLESNFEYELQLTNEIVEMLSDIVGVVVYTPPKDNHIGVISFNVEGYHAEDVGMILDQDYDIAVRTGYHCAPYIHRLLNDEKYIGTVRVGLSRYTTIEDINTFVNAIRDISNYV